MYASAGQGSPHLIDGHTTYRLRLGLPAEARNVYAIFGEASSRPYVPAAWFSDLSQGATSPPSEKIYSMAVRACRTVSLFRVGFLFNVVIWSLCCFADTMCRALSKHSIHPSCRWVRTQSLASTKDRLARPFSAGPKHNHCRLDHHQAQPMIFRFFGWTRMGELILLVWPRVYMLMWVGSVQAQ